jgi:DNA-binding transcriptional LysR family regulator
VDLNDVALFVNIVRAGSFAEAGRRLGMPPSTASRRLQALEATLGARLMQRTTRRLVLTDAGRNFYEESADRIDALLLAASQAGHGRTEVAGRVRIAVPADFFTWFPAKEMARFILAHPRVRLEFELDDAKVDLLKNGIDVAMRPADRDPALIARRIGNSPTVLVASPAYLEQRGNPKTPSELTTHDCISLPARGGPSAKWHLIGPDGSGTAVEVDGPFQANTALAQLSGALAGLGIAMLPAVLCAEHIRGKRLQTVLPGFGSGNVGLHFVYLSRRQLPCAVSAFLDFAVATIKDLALL